jgi:predicted N-acetyltransferase YhbS
VSVQVDHLFNHPEHIRLVATWIYKEFWLGKPGYSAEFFESLLRDADDPDRIPLSLFALAHGQPVGTVNLIHSDSERRPELHPWLAALVVIPGCRGQGIGSLLVRSLLAEAGRLKVAELFLGTDIPGFYSRLGATVLEQVTDTMCIMRIELQDR